MRLTVAIVVLLLLAPVAGRAGAVRGVVRLPGAVGGAPAFEPYAGRASSLPGAARAARGRVTDAVLSIEGVPAGVDERLPAAAAPRPRLSQAQQQFTPRVLVVRAGTTVDFPNLDPIYHNVFSVSPARRFDLGKYPRGDSRAVTFPRPGVINVYCDIHSDMAAFIVVTPNRAFAQPDEDGAYQLPPLPPGRYTLVWWHPDFPGGRREVSVPESGDVTVDVGF
jgi:plastocyanin